MPAKRVLGACERIDCAACSSRKFQVAEAKSQHAAVCFRPHSATGRRLAIRASDRLVGRSPDLEVLCRLLAAVAGDLILNGLPFIEGAQACALDCGDVDEHVLASALRLNETIAF